MQEPKLEAVRAYVDQKFDQYVHDLEALVNINTRHKDKAGNAIINTVLRQHIAKTNGNVKSWISDDGLEHLVAEYRGQGKYKIALIVHTDTVLDNTDFQYRYDAKTKIAYGPGAGDCKASVVMAMHLIEAYQHFDYLPFDLLSIYYDAEEEGGSPMEEQLVKQLAQTHDYVLVADTGRPDYGIVTRRKCTGRITLRIHGINGHGGNALQAGANVLYESGFLLSKIFALQSPMPKDHDPKQMTRDALLQKGVHDHGQFIPENTLNVRKLEHSAVNIPDYAEIVIAVATFDNQERQRLADEVKQLCQYASVPGCRIEYHYEPLMEIMKVDQHMVDLYKKTAQEAAGITISDWQAGGITMASIASQYAKTLDGVGVDCDPLCEHTLTEEIDLNAVNPRLLSLFYFLGKLES